MGKIRSFIPTGAVTAKGSDKPGHFPAKRKPLRFAPIRPQCAPIQGGRIMESKALYCRFAREHQPLVEPLLDDALARLLDKQAEAIVKDGKTLASASKPLAKLDRKKYAKGLAKLGR